MVKQCFRCGANVKGFQSGGQVTISGFYDNKRFPYYNNFTLCAHCHEKLTLAINDCLYGYEEDNNGTSNDA